MSKLLEDVCTLMGQSADKLEKAAALLNCKVVDLKKATATLMEQEGRQSVSVVRAGRTYSMEYVRGSVDGEMFDVEAAKRLLIENGLPVPMKRRKGKSPSVSIK